MTEKKLIDLFVEFCSKVVIEDQKEKRGNKEPALSETPVNIDHNVNNNIKQQNNFIEQTGTVIEISRQKTQYGDPGINMIIELDNGKKVRKFFTVNNKGKFYIYRDLLKPLGFDISKNADIQEYQNFDYEQFQNEKFIVETEKNEKGYLIIEKFVSKVSEQESIW